MSDTGFPSDGGAPANNGPDTGSSPSSDINSGQSFNPATQQEPTGNNPAWGPLLEALPTNLHGIVTPHLSKFDSEFNSRLESERQRYAPYNDFINNKVDPQVLAGALQVMQLIESDPRTFYDRMGAYYANEWGLDQGQQTDEDDEYSLDLDEGDEPTYQDPRFDTLKQQQDVIANFLAQDVQRREAEAQAAEQKKYDEQLATEVESVKTKYGENFSEDAMEMALTLAIQNNISFPDAADKVMQFRGQQAPSAPTILPTSGGTASQSVNPANLSRQDTRKLVEQRLRMAAGG